MMATADGGGGHGDGERGLGGGGPDAGARRAGGGTKERVSVRNVRKELGGGSHEDIGPPLARWKANKR